MGGLKDATIQDDGFNDFLKELLDRGALEGAAEGITKKVIADGEESLSEKQMHVFKTHVLGEFVTDECSRCGTDIPWSEMSAAYESGMCSWCEHMTNKDD
jgi:NAD-dependent SIR2 family protein deacetylase